MGKKDDKEPKGNTEEVDGPDTPPPPPAEEGETPDPEDGQGEDGETPDPK